MTSLPEALALLAKIGGFVSDPLNLAQLLVVALGLVGQYLINLKNIQGLYAWIVSNIVAIGLMWHSGMYIMMGMYLAYLVMCGHGVYLWRKDAAGRLPS